MAISTTEIKELKDRTGLGMVPCKKALVEADGDMEKAIEVLRKQGLKTVEEKSGRTTAEGLVEAYIHPGNRVGTLIEVNCETDFVARNPDFRQFVRDLCMQVAAMEPRAVDREGLPTEMVAQEKEILKSQVEDKPPHIVEKIVAGRLEQFYERHTLLDQLFIKDETLKVRDLLNEKIAKFKENIRIRRFARFQLGSHQ